MSILDTIDNAISDWDTSADAMRWTPDAPAVPPARFPRIVGPTPEQVEDMGRRLTAVFEPLGRQLAAIGDALQRLDLSHFNLTRQEKPQRRPARVSQIRRAYRAKRRRE